MKKIIIASLLCLFCVLAVVFGSNVISFIESDSDAAGRQGKLEKILSHKELRVVLDFNTINYFIYQGEPRGFQYELLNEFCKENGLTLKIFSTNDIHHSVAGLVRDEYDLVAKNMISGYFDNDSVEYTEPLLKSKIVLVQRKNAGNEGKTKPSAVFIDARSELAGRKVYVSENSPFRINLDKLSMDIVHPVQMITDSVLTTEQLIAKVSSGDIDYTICNEKTANFLGAYFKNLDFSTPIAFDQEFSWIVSSRAVAWKRYLDNWIDDFKTTDRYQEICEAYYSVSSRKNFGNKKYNSFVGGKLSDYDDLIKSIASVYDIDWRLVSSIIYKESQFDNYAESNKGAIGLMQLMPITADFLNVFDRNDPGENIRGGVAYIAWLDDIFRSIISDKEERLKFVLAAYNAGIGHVMDARKLAMKYNYDPSVWEGNVEYFMLKKSDPEFYNDPVVEHGYCRGNEPVNFVDKVLYRYQHYQNIIPSDEHTSLAVL